MTLRLESSGERLDAALARLVPELSRSQAQRLLAQGLVTANGKPLKKNEKSTAGMVLELTLPEAQETDLPAQEIPLDIRYEDSDVIVINKPKGIVVHPAPGTRTGRWSTRCCITAAILFPVSAGKSAPALSTGLTRTRRGF